MYQCSNCGHMMSYPLERCPGCHAILSGIRCQACNYVGGKSEFINNGHRCPKCSSTVYVPGGYTPSTTYSSPSSPATIAAADKSPTLASVLSFFLLGGAGQIYLGQWKKGLVLMLATWLLGIPGIIAVADAYGTAKKLSDGNSVGEWEFNINWKVALLVATIYVILICGVVFAVSLSS